VQCTSDSEYTGPPALDSVAPEIRFAPARVPAETVRPGARTPGRGARSRWPIALRRSLAIQFQPRGVLSWWLSSCRAPRGTGVLRRASPRDATARVSSSLRPAPR